jgi:hypothetical protein
LPTVDLKCGQGHTWSAIKGKTIVDPDADRCPTCGSTDIETVIGGVYALRDGAAQDTDEWERTTDPLEKQMVMKNKRILESRSEEILDGRITIDEKGPKGTRPECPAHLLKSYHFVGK